MKCGWFRFIGVAAVVVLALVAVGMASRTKDEKPTPTSNSSQQEAQPVATGSSIIDQINQKYPTDVINTQSFECEARNDNEWYRTGHSLAIDPSNPDVMYVSIEYRGVYKTVDGGKNWAKKSKGIKAYANAKDPTKPCYSEYPTIKVNPQNPKHVVVVVSGGGGGHLSLTEPNSQTGGLYQSFDSGETWSIMIKEKMNLYATDAVFEPGSKETLFYTSSSNPASYTEADQTKVFVEKGLVYKTTDSGKNWSELPTGLGNKTSATRILINSANTKEMVVPTFSATRLSADGSGTGVSTGKDTSTPQLGILKTTDGGQTWAAIAGSTSTAYTSAAASTNNFKNMFFIPFTSSGEPYGLATTDGGASLVKTKTMDAVAYDPYDTTGMHILGFSSMTIGPASQNLTLQESMDGGKTWKKYGTLPKEITDPQNKKMRVTQISWHPTQKQTIFLNGAGGQVWKSIDGGTTWTRLLSYEQAQ